MKSLKKPNILLLYTDQQRLDSIRIFGNEKAITPNLDELAKDGMRFSKCFVQNPVCQPSRKSFLTSQYPSSLGIGSNGFHLLETTQTLVDIIKPYGYKTAQIGKLHFLPHSKRDHRTKHPDYGFDTIIVSDEPGCYDDPYTKWVESINQDMLCKVRTALPPAALEKDMPSYSNRPRNTHNPYLFEAEKEYTHSAFVSSETCRIIDNYKDQPFFIISGFYAPHTPVNPVREFVDLYKDTVFDEPIFGPDDKWMPMLENLSDEEKQKIKRYYYALVTNVDYEIGNIINHLKEVGEYENTIIIFTSDHGEYLLDYGKIQKSMPSDCILNVPLIISYKSRLESNVHYDQLLESIDVAPTILDLLGIQTPPTMQGKSFLPLIKNKSDIHRENVFSEHFGLNDNQFSFVLRTKNYKYYIDESQKEYLYDLNNDKNAIYNIANKEEYKDVLIRMQKELIIRIANARYRRKDKNAEY